MKRIGLHGVPRSGTSWLGNIFNSNPYLTYKHQPLYSYAFKNYLNKSSKLEDILRFFEEISNSTDDYVNQIDLIKKGLVPDFNKSELSKDVVVYKGAHHHHILETLLKEDLDFRLVGIVRNPMATLWSWKNAPNEFKKDWNFQTEWQNANLKNQGLEENFYGYFKWKEVANLFDMLKMEYWDRVTLINYSEFIKNPLKSTYNMFWDLGLDLEPQTVKFINDSNSENKGGAYSVYRNKDKDDDWVGRLPNEIVEHIIDDLNDTNLSKYLDI
jgi:hypothetical protein